MLRRTRPIRPTAIGMLGAAGRRESGALFGAASVGIVNRGIRASTTLYRTSPVDRALPVPLSQFLGHALSAGRHHRMLSMAIRYTAPAGGRSRYCVYLIASAASTATATSSCRTTDFCPAANSYPPKPRPVLVVVVDEDGRRPSGFDVTKAAQLPRALGFVIDSAGDPAIDDGEADRHQADHPVAANRAQPGDSCPLQSVRDPVLVHSSIIAAPMGSACPSRPNLSCPRMLASLRGCVASRRCRRPAQGSTSAAMPVSIEVAARSGPPPVSGGWLRSAARRFRSD